MTGMPIASVTRCTCGRESRTPSGAFWRVPL